MKENCFDIGTIQAFLDGELASDRVEAVACHIADCDDCSMQFAAAEEETAFAFNALEQEFNTLVPTQRLWTKINDSIERERRSFWAPIFAFFRNPALATFAACLLLFAVFVAYLNNGNNVEVVSTPKRNAPVQTAPSSETAAVSTTTGTSPGDLASKTSKDLQDEETSTPVEPQKSFRVVKTSYNSSSRTPKPDNPNHPKPDVSQTTATVYEYLPGEESYIKTIETLKKTIDGSKDEVMKPSTRVTFEKNLALVDNAIKNMKEQVKKDPKNEAAKQVLLSSYQNKVDLLTSVAEKSELMASYK